MLHIKPASQDAAAPARAPARLIADGAYGALLVPRNLPIIERAKTLRPQREQTRPATDAGAVERVLQSFNTWAFKREQPDSPALLREVIGRGLQAQAPLSFVLYWGKGPRRTAAAPETTSLDYLHALATRVTAAYGPGAAIRLICTDTHARLNGHPEDAIADYFASVRGEASRRGFTDCYLSALVQALEESAAGMACEDAPDPHTLNRLTTCAAKWYRGEGSPDQAAAEYFRMNMVEKRAVEHAFPQAIFITFNGSEFRCLFPERMPVFYMYSLKRGVAAKPWFLPDPAE